jgi:hypothetical protein
MGCYGRFERLMAILLGSLSGGMQPTAPTIGTATSASDTTASVAFTASSYIGKGTITYTATSSPGGLTGTSATSPITVTGLTTGTAYTFTVVGTTNYGVSSAASASSNSVTPVSPTAFASIATFIPTGSSQAVSFTSIPQTYKHLQLRVYGASTGGSSDFAYMKFNGVTASTNFFSQGFATTTSLYAYNYGGSYNAILLGTQAGTGGQGSNVPSVGVIDILNYTSTTQNKTVRGWWGYANTSAGALEYTGGLWYDTPAAITSIQITCNFNFPSANSSWALYGIKGA